jgi:SAM-dependent methyltransferase
MSVNTNAAIRKIARIVKRVYYSSKTYSLFLRRFIEKADILANNRFSCKWSDRWPCLTDATGQTGFDAHYLYHTAWAARILARTRPSLHIDIGYCLRFATLVSAFVPVDFYDFCPAEIRLSNLRCRHADLLALPFEDASVRSLSCMHVVEHIGLERYVDPFDPKGALKAIAELGRVLAAGGDLLFVVPVGGVARIQYNAHRIYTYLQIQKFFGGVRAGGFFTDHGRG